MPRILDDVIFTTADYEPWDDDYSYLDEPDTVDSWLYCQDEAADRFHYVKDDA